MYKRIQRCRTEIEFKIKEFEEVLLRNIYEDEFRIEQGKEPLNQELNEEIKKAIVDVSLLMHKEEKKLKVYLDDKRETPEGFVRAFWPSDVKSYLNNLDVSMLSLDHDLSDDTQGTGYDVVCYVEEKTYNEKDYIPPEIIVHSSNSSAKEKMENGINNINKIKREKLII